MQDQATASGHVFCVERKRGPQWYCKFRVGVPQLPGHQGPGSEYLREKSRLRGNWFGGCSDWDAPITVVFLDDRNTSESPDERIDP